MSYCHLDVAAGAQCVWWELDPKWQTGPFGSKACPPPFFFDNESNYTYLLTCLLFASTMQQNDLLVRARAHARKKFNMLDLTRCAI